MLGSCKATLRGIQHACSQTSPPYTKLPETLDSDLLDAVVGKIEAYAADAAGDQQLAGRELCPALGLSGTAVADLPGVLVQCLPNLKV